MSECVGIYCRLSDEDRDKGDLQSESIQNQIEMLSSYCKSKGWRIYDIYCDEDFSGADRSRPDFNRLITDCRNKRIDTVLCKTQSRFSRDMEIIEKYIHGKFDEWGIRFIGLVDGVDSFDKNNKKTRQINGLVNEWYLEDLSENIKKTLRSKNRNGKFTGAFAPYGYKCDENNKNKLLPDKYAADTVKMIFDKYLNGWSCSAIAEHLNARHILSPTLYKRASGSKYRNLKAGALRWQASSVRYILTQEVYIGRVVSHKSEKISFKSPKRKCISDDERIRVESAHEAVIDKDTWEKVQSLIKAKRRTGCGSRKAYALSGKVFCDTDNHRMVISTSNGYTYIICKTCKTRWRYRDVQDAVLQRLNAHCACGYIDNGISRDREKKRLEDCIKRREREKEIIYADRLDGILTGDFFKNKAKEIDDEIKVLKCEAEALQEEGRGEDGKAFSSLTCEAVNLFIEKISLSESGRLTIFWNF